MYTIKPIRTKIDYQAALARAEAIFQAQPGEPEFDELDILGTLIEAYEARHYPIPKPDPIGYIKVQDGRARPAPARLGRMAGQRKPG